MTLYQGVRLLYLLIALGCFLYCWLWFKRHLSESEEPPKPASLGEIVRLKARTANFVGSGTMCAVCLALFAMM